MKNLKYVKLFENFKKNKLINEDNSQVKKIGLVDKKYFEDTYFKKSETPPNYTQNYLKLSQEGLDMKPGLYYPIFVSEKHGWFFLNFDDSGKKIISSSSKDYFNYSADFGIGAENQKSKFGKDIIPDTLDTLKSTGLVDVYKFETLEKGSTAGWYRSENNNNMDNPTFVIL
jgi:hypothetical protein